MFATTHEKMHAEHRSWEHEINLWRDDLRAWQHEPAKTQGELKQLEEALARHARTLQQHEIVKYEQGGEGEELFNMARQHSHEALRHAELRAACTQLKRLHQTVIAHWNISQRALCAAGPGPPSR